MMRQTERRRDKSQRVKRVGVAATTKRQQFALKLKALKLKDTGRYTY